MDAKVFQLLNDLIEQRLDAEQVAELTELLRRDPKVVEKYLQFLGIHQELANSETPVRPFSLEELRAIKAVEEQFGNGLSPDPTKAAESDRSAAPAGTLVRSVARSGPRKDRIRLALWGMVIAVAVMVLIAITLISNSHRDGNDDRVVSVEPTETATQPQPSGMVARIIKKVDCDWHEDRWHVAPSARIAAGQQINLSRGLLVLQFNSGAEITLDGPATLVATSETSAKLLEGKLSARVPPRGRGFKVETHAGDFVDLGTEFGMIVSSDGAVETHVFSGKVIAEPTQIDAAEQNVVLETGVAWARSALGVDDESAVAKPALFMRPTISDDGAPSDSPPVERKLALWFRAASRVQLDQNGNVSAWGDNINATNVRAENAWQVTASKRPGWVADAIGGEPALRFDGYKSLVTEPIRLGANQTSAVVFRVDGDAARDLIRQRTTFQHLGVQLLNLNGFPHTVMQVNDDVRLESRVHLGFVRDQPDPVDVGLVRSDNPLDGNAHVALYTYDAESSVARLFIDGTLIAESNDAPEIAETTSPRYLGSHYGREGFGFTGDIAEILVFDTALLADEAQAVSLWLAERYRID